MQHIFAALAVAFTILPHTPAAWGAPAPAAARAALQAPAATDAQALVDDIVRQLDAYWRTNAPTYGFTYAPARVVIASDAKPIGGACGASPTVDGHYYCSKDRTMYLDLDEDEEFSLEVLIDAGYENAVAMLVAHEFGHHVQNLAGVFKRHLTSKEVELQADCLAGLFMRASNNKDWVKPASIVSIVRMVADEIADPDNTDEDDEDAHGDADERATAFLTGFLATEQRACGL